MRLSAIAAGSVVDCMAFLRVIHAIHNSNLKLAVAAGLCLALRPEKLKQRKGIEQVQP